MRICYFYADIMDPRLREDDDGVENDRDKGSFKVSPQCPKKH